MKCLRDKTSAELFMEQMRCRHPTPFSIFVDRDSTEIVEMLSRASNRDRDMVASREIGGDMR